LRREAENWIENQSHLQRGRGWWRQSLRYPVSNWVGCSQWEDTT